MISHICLSGNRDRMNPKLAVFIYLFIYLFFYFFIYLFIYLWDRVNIPKVK